MNSLTRHYLRDIIRVFVLFSLAFSFVFTLIGLFDRYDNYVSAGLGPVEIAEVVVLRVPEFLGYIIPMSFMLSLVMVFSFANKNREVLILKVSGANLRVFLLPFLVLCVLVMMLHLLVQEGLNPVAKKKALSIESPGARGFLYKSGSLWLKVDDRTILRAKTFNPFNGQMRDVYVFFFGERGIERILYARRAFNTENFVTLVHTTEYDLIDKKVRFRSTIERALRLDEDIMGAGRRRIEGMSGLELLRIYNSLKKAGIENVRLGVDLQRRLAFPLYTLVLALVGIFLGLRFSSPWVSTGMATVVLVFIWAGITLFTALGYAGTVSPLLSGWALPLGGIFISLWLFSRIRV